MQCCADRIQSIQNYLKGPQIYFWVFTFISTPIKELKHKNMEVLIWLNLDKLIYRIFFPLPQPRQKRNEKKAYEKTRNSFRWITLRECSSGCLVGIFFIGVLNRGEVENWTCKNSPLFSGSPKSFAAKADFVLCLASHFYTTRQFLHFYIFTIPHNQLPFTFLQPPFSLSHKDITSRWQRNR